MTYEEMVLIADQNFRDDQDICVTECFADPESHNGDSLAAHVVSEIDGVAGFGNDDVEELRDAAFRMDLSTKILAAVTDGYRAEARQRENVHGKSQQKRAAKKPRGPVAQSPAPNDFKPGDYVQTANWRTTSFGRVMCVRETFGFSAPKTMVQLHCIEWADRTRSIEVVDDHEPVPQDPLSAATKAQFDVARRKYDRLITALQPGATFIMHDTMPQGFLVVVQAPMPVVLKSGAAWIGSKLFPMGDLSTSNPPGTRKPPDQSLYVVAREISRDKLRAVRVETGFIEASPSAIVAGPFRKGASQRPASGGRHHVRSK